MRTISWLNLRRTLRRNQCLDHFYLQEPLHPVLMEFFLLMLLSFGFQSAATASAAKDSSMVAHAAKVESTPAPLQLVLTMNSSNKSLLSLLLVLRFQWNPVEVLIRLRVPTAPQSPQEERFASLSQHLAAADLDPLADSSTVLLLLPALALRCHLGLPLEVLPKPLAHSSSVVIASSVTRVDLVTTKITV